MKRLFWLLAFVVCAAGPIRPAFALVALSSSSASVGPRLTMLAWPKETLTYKETGNFTGTIQIEKSIDGVNFVPINISTVNNATGGTFTGKIYNGDQMAFYRWNASTITAGSFISVLSQNDDLVGQFQNLRKQTVMQLNDESVTVNGNETVTGNSNVTGNSAITGNETVTGDLKSNGYFYVIQSTAPRSATVGLTPSATYAFVINTTDNELCMSTSTNKFSWVEVSTPTAACKH